MCQEESVSMYRCCYFLKPGLHKTPQTIVPSPGVGSSRIRIKDANIFQVEEFPQSYFAKSSNGCDSSTGRTCTVCPLYHLRQLL